MNSQVSPGVTSRSDINTLEKFDWPRLCLTPEPVQYTAVEKGDRDKLRLIGEL